MLVCYNKGTKEREVTTMKMTKAMMIDVIEKSGMVVDFDRKYLMKKDKQYLERLYNHCVKFIEKN